MVEARLPNQWQDYSQTAATLFCVVLVFSILIHRDCVHYKAQRETIAVIEHKYIHFNLRKYKKKHVQFMYKLFVQDSMFISRLYLTESGRSTQHHQSLHFSKTVQTPFSCNEQPNNETEISQFLFKK